MEESLTTRRTTRMSSRNLENAGNTSTKKTKRVLIIGNATYSDSDGRETDSLSSQSERDLPSISSSISRATYHDDLESWNRSSQTEGLYSTNGYVRTVDMLKEFRAARKSFLDCSAVQYLMQYSRDTDEKAKTGYTYASGASYQLNGDPNVPMPNMSRYGLDHYARCTDNGYDYSLSESRTSSSLGRGLDFSESSRSSMVTTPEPSSGLRGYMSKIYRSVMTTTTTTNSTAHNGYDDRPDEKVKSVSRLRFTPESRSGNDYSELQERSYLSANTANMSSTTDYTKNNTFHTADVSLGRSETPALAAYYGSPYPSRTRIRSSAHVEASPIERISRRFIDIITRNTITNVETSRHAELDDRRRRGLGWCCLLPLLLLLFLPLLGGLCWLAPSSLRESASAAQSVIQHSYRDFSSFLFPPLKDSPPFIILPTATNNTNATSPGLQVIYVKEPATCPVVKTCCDDVLLVKSQVALILERLVSIQSDEAWRSEYEKNREARDQDTRLAVEELRLMLIRLENEMSTRGQIVPQLVRDRESFSLEDVKRLVAESIQRYDEDKTGEPDHALESSGATVISTRCSEDYQWGHSQERLFGIPIPFTKRTTSPRLAIQPDMRPGQCWAFKGDQGYLVIKLPGDVRPTSFTLEHLPKNLSPTGKIDSAPKNFEVYGLVSEQGPGYLLGSYTYEDNGIALQNFQIMSHLEHQETFPFVELRITSNHGNPDYTCLYRFRVHGDLVNRH